MVRLNSFKLSLKDKILLALSIGVDSGKSLHRFPFTSSGVGLNFPFSYDLAVDKLYSFLGGERSVFYSTMSKVIREKLVSKDVRGEKTFLRVTDFGRDLLSLKYPHLFLKTEKWDGNWRMIVFDIPEKDRNRRDKLRNILVNLFCVPLFDSLWISPNNIFPLVENFGNTYHIESCLSYIIGTISEKDQERAVKLAGLEWVSERYKMLLAEMRESKQRRVCGKIPNLGSKFLEIYARDPRWPRELLPKEWWGEKVKKMVVGDL